MLHAVLAEHDDRDDRLLQLKELGDQVDEANKEEIESAIKEVRDALASDDAEAIKAKTEALQEAFHMVSEQVYAKALAEAEAGAANGDGAEAAGSDEEEVIDAEVVEDDK